MQVNRLIIHELIKEAQSNFVDYKSSSNLININAGIDNLIEHVHAAFEQSITKYSKFKEANTSNSVYFNINRYLNGENTDDQFVAFSKASLNELAALIQREPFATGGYYLFVDYVENGFNYISIIIARNKDAFNIKWTGNNFNVDSTENVNIDKLAMGFRANCGLYLDKDDTRNYIALISHQGDELSKYFIRWVNADLIIDNKANTRQLISIIKDIGAPEGYENPDEFERHVHDWIDAYRKANQNTINVDVLSEAFYGKKTAIRDYSQNTLHREIDPVFKVSISDLKRLIRYKASTKGLSVSIDIDKFIKEEVELRDGMLIIKDQTIYEELQRQRQEQ